MWPLGTETLGKYASLYLNRLDTEVIRDLHYQVVGNHSHKDLTRSQGNPVRKLPLSIYDVPSLAPSVRRSSHPETIIRPAQELKHRWVVFGKVDDSPRLLSQGLENPLPQEFLRDCVLKP